MSKQAAIDRVEVGNAEWIDEAYAAWIINHPYKGAHVTSDDVWAAVGEFTVAQPREPRAMGAVLRRLQRFGYLKPLKKWQPSTRACCHGRPVRVWRVL